MIKDAWPFNFEPYDTLEKFNKMVRPYCPYSKRFTLFCGARRAKCMTCYMKQQSLTDAQMLQDRYPVVEHYCDRCGRKIDLVDKIMYLHVQDREARNLINLELCGTCSYELAEWIEDKQEPEEE